MKKWKVFKIVNNFDNSAVEISWDGITIKDAQDEVLELAKKAGKSKIDYLITRL